MFFLFDVGIGVFEVEMGGDFFVGLVYGVFDFYQVGFVDGIE